MTRLYDELRDAVAGRNVDSRVDSSGRRLTALAVRFGRALSSSHLAALTAETPHATVQVPGSLAPLAVELSPTLVTLILDAIDPATLRLDTLLSSLAWSGSPLGSPLSAYVIVELCRVVQALHTTGDPHGNPRVHGEIHAGSVLVLPGGHLVLVGCGLPAVTSVMLDRLKNRGDRHRLLAPEAARGEPLDPRADVYSLGVLYYELLSGHRYRDKLNPTSVAQAAIEGRPPDLPGALPDPRRDLVHVLSRALAPHRDQRFQNARMFGDAIMSELASAKIPIPNAALLERMIDEFVPAGVERGKKALLRVEHDPAELEAVMSGAAETVGNAPAQVHIPTETPTSRQPPAAASDAWARVLGEHVDPPTIETETQAEKPAKVSLPLPSADPPSGLTLPSPIASTAPSSGPTQPLSGEKLAALARPVPRSRSQPPVEKEEDRHFAIRIAGGLLAVALAVAVGYGLQHRPAAPEPTEDPIDVVYDASAPAIAATPDSGVEKAKPVGLLTVLSKPSGATVEVDGGFVGKTPLVMRHEFQHRPYQIRVLFDGYEPWEQTAYPDAKDAISLIAELVKK